MTKSLKVFFDKVASLTHQHECNDCCKLLPDFPKEQLYGLSSTTAGNGSTSKNAPLSPVDILSNDFFTLTGQCPKCMIQAALQQAVTENKDYAKFREISNWNEALSVLKNDQVTGSHFERVVDGSAATGNQKQPTLPALDMIFSLLAAPRR